MTAHHATPAQPWGDPTAGPVPEGLVAAKSLVYDPCGFDCPAPVAEEESADYGAYALSVNGRPVRFRVARTTPTKVGQFVTVWQRSPEGPIRPFDTGDGVGLFVIDCRDGADHGQFVFPSAVLCARDVVSRDGVGGKRGFRVYPPWASPTARQAERTRSWQLEHFLALPGDGSVDLERARALYRA
ncbi:MepB family protein [Streptomyces sp. NBC_01426]|uniref:MepB family protein n=1 Tax=unclassified Streptomyces TaxID=2593676 RepID=UPI002E2EEFF9|nr:MepB family protein [Streptomyces sp. NBC_01426]